MKYKSCEEYALFFCAGDNLFSFVPKWLRQINSLSTRWAEFQKSLRKCQKFMKILDLQ